MHRLIARSQEDVSLARERTFLMRSVTHDVRPNWATSTKTFGGCWQGALSNQGTSTQELTHFVEALEPISTRICGGLHQISGTVSWRPTQ